LHPAKILAGPTGNYDLFAPEMRTTGVGAASLFSAITVVIDYNSNPAFSLTQRC
jgi:hypothetical protein